MKNNRISFVMILVSLIILILAFPILIHDPIFMDSQQRSSPGVLFSSYGSSGAYRFDPTTIIESMERGNTASFTSLDKTVGEQLYTNPFPWSQSDYLMIANAVHEFVWKEKVDSWNLHDLSFSGNCEYDPMGFDIIEISYYKLTGLQEYSAHMIGIYPLTGEGEWGGGVKFTHSVFSRWKNINLEKLKVTAEEALQIAENNGGEQARLAIKNRCSIHLILGPYRSPSWLISYYQNVSAQEIFEIRIDAYTGGYNVTEINN